VAKRKSVLFLLKLLFSAAVLAFFFLLTKTSLKDIGLKLRGVSWGWLALAFSLQGPGLLISAHRWRILARAQGDDVPLLFLVKSYLVGMFFNNFLPTRFGGDVVRIWDGSKYSKSLLKSSAVVLVDRATGIIVLFLFALIAALFRLDMAREVPVIWAALAFGLIGLAGVIFFFLPLFGRWLRKIPERGFLKPFKQKVIDFRTTIIFYKNKRKEFGRATAWAVLLQMNVILFYFLIGRALHLTIPLLDYFIFIPLVLLIQIIPITINGLGLREGAYIEIFKFYGIPAASALAFSIIEVAFGLILGLIGGAIYVSRK
jgi:hypothetical protein